MPHGRAAHDRLQLVYGVVRTRRRAVWRSLPPRALQWHPGKITSIDLSMNMVAYDGNKGAHMLIKAIQRCKHQLTENNEQNKVKNEIGKHLHDGSHPTRES